MTPQRIYTPNQAQGRPQAQDNVALPPGKVMRVHVLLSAKDYFAPTASMACESNPPFPLFFELLYSPVMDTTDSAKKKILYIEKHELLRIFGTGVIIELWDAPEWWANRDKGLV